MTEPVTDSNFTLSDESTVPLYFQLMMLIKRQIHSGILKPGDMVPSESQLCSQYKVSRSTVRQALNQLVEENLIIRRRGKGSFIANQKMHRSLNHLYSFTEDMLTMGLNPHSKVLESTVIHASDDIIHSLNLPSDKTEVFKLIRLRMANNEPLLLETTHIPLYLCPEIVNEDFSSTSLYSILQSKYSLNLYRAVETFESIRLAKEYAVLLNCHYQIDAFNIQRIAYLDTGIAFELTNSIARADKCVFKVELFANKNKVNFSRQITL
jgi:Transcriptional regulators